MSDSSSPTTGIDASGRYPHDPSRHAVDRTEPLGSSGFTLLSHPVTLGISNSSLPSLSLGHEIPSPISFDFPMEVMTASRVGDYYGEGIDYYAPRSATSSSFGHETFCINAPQTCITIAIHTLRNIRVLKNSTTPICIQQEATCTNRPSPRPIGNILAAQHDTVSKLLSILKCSCSTLPNVRILLGIVCDRIITESSIILGHSHTDQVKPQPVRVGAFSSDGPLSQRVCACIVLENLQVLQSQMSRLLDHSKSEQMALYDDVSTEVDNVIKRYLNTVVCGNLRETIEQTRRSF